MLVFLQNSPLICNNPSISSKMSYARHPMYKLCFLPTPWTNIMIRAKWWQETIWVMCIIRIIEELLQIISNSRRKESRFAYIILLNCGKTEGGMMLICTIVFRSTVENTKVASPSSFLYTSSSARAWGL